MNRQKKVAQHFISVFRLSLLAFFMLGGSALICENKVISKINNKKQPEKETWITIFVHGIKSVRPHLSASNFLKFIRDDVEDTVYARTIDLMRRDPHFYKNQVMQGLGLQKINPDDIHKGYAAGAMAYLFNEMFKQIGKSNKLDNHYYTFGWSGLLSPSMRFKDGTQLFMELEKEVQRYQKLYNITPKVRVIAYSHGGNVCLNLGAAHQKVFPNSDLVVEELILIGVPIQSATDYLIEDSVFKRVYHFYSLGDRIQKLDFFASDRPLSFSRRNFATRPGFKPPKKLFQIQLKVLRNTKTSPKYIQRRKKLTRNFNKKSIISGKSHLFRDISPGHTEVWFFGWSPQHYRAHFPLNPIPAIAFAPLIINEINKVENKLPVPHPFIVDIRPAQETMLIKRKNNKLISKTDFVSNQKLDMLKKQTLRFKPDNYTGQLYNDHMYAAYEHALVQHTEDNKKKNPLAHSKAIKRQQEKAVKRAKRNHKKTITQQAHHSNMHKTHRRGRKKIALTKSLHTEINCPFCFDSEIKKMLTT